MADNRREQTKRNIESALARLLLKEDFNKITTQQIAQEAGISRGSFYNHFHDKYDLVDQYQKRIFSYLDALFNTEDRLDTVTLTALTLMQGEPLAAALLSPAGTYELQIYLIGKFKQVLTHELPNLSFGKSLTGIEVDYALNYLAYAYLGFVQTWIANGQKESPEKLTQLLMKLK